MEKINNRLTIEIKRALEKTLTSYDNELTKEITKENNDIEQKIEKEAKKALKIDNLMKLHEKLKQDIKIVEEQIKEKGLTFNYSGDIYGISTTKEYKDIEKNTSYIIQKLSFTEARRSLFMATTKEEATKILDSFKNQLK